MTKASKKIAFISIPHMVAESEEARQDGKERFPLVVASGSQPKSIVLDYSRSIEDSPIKRGLYLKNIGFIRTRARVLPVDYEYVEALNRQVVGYLKNYSPSVENPGIGEYFIDLTGTERLFGRTLDTCGKIVQLLGKLFRLTARCGIGNTTLISRLAAEVSGDGGVYEILQNPAPGVSPVARSWKKKLMRSSGASASWAAKKTTTISSAGSFSAWSSGCARRCAGSACSRRWRRSRSCTRTTIGTPPRAGSPIPPSTRRSSTANSYSI